MSEKLTRIKYHISITDFCMFVLVLRIVLHKRNSMPNGIRVKAGIRNGKAEGI